MKNIKLRIARLLPDWLIYWCGIVLWAHATTREYGDTIATGITMDEILKRWEKK